MQSAPKWDIEHKADSLTQWVEYLNEEARLQFLKAGTHIEIFFIFNALGLVEIVPIVGMDKEDVLEGLKNMLSDSDGYAFIHISEGTMRRVDTDEEVDVLLVHSESRDGISVAYCSTVVKRGEDVLLMDSVKVDNFLKGRFTNIFSDIRFRR